MTVEVKFVDISKKIAEQYYPKPARNSLPQWYLELEAYHGGKPSLEDNAINDTAKRCIPMIDVMSTGYILFTPTDINVTLDENGVHYFQWPHARGIELHSNWQLKGHKKAEQFVGIPKYVMDWAIWTPPGYSCLITPPFNRDDSVFEIFSGVIDTDKYHIPGSLPFLLSDPKFTGLIPAGTPLAQVTPFRRESYKMTIGDESDVKESEGQFEILRSVFRNAYRKFFWSPKSYK